MDPAALRVAIPGCESLTETGPDAYDIIVKVGATSLPTEASASLFAAASCRLGDPPSTTT
jgi:carbon monoxide dehydrogenase subunit G